MAFCEQLRTPTTTDICSAPDDPLRSFTEIWEDPAPQLGFGESYGFPTSISASDSAAAAVVGGCSLRDVSVFGSDGPICVFRRCSALGLEHSCIHASPRTWLWTMQTGVFCNCRPPAPKTLTWWTLRFPSRLSSVRGATPSRRLDASMRGT